MSSAALDANWYSKVTYWQIFSPSIMHPILRGTQSLPHLCVCVCCRNGIDWRTRQTDRAILTCLLIVIQQPLFCAPPLHLSCVYCLCARDSCPFAWAAARFYFFVYDRIITCAQRTANRLIPQSIMPQIPRVTQSDGDTPLLTVNQCWCQTDRPLLARYLFPYPTPWCRFEASVIGESV